MIIANYPDSAIRSYDDLAYATIARLVIAELRSSGAFHRGAPATPMKSLTYPHIGEKTTADGIKRRKHYNHPERK